MQYHTLFQTYDPSDAKFRNLPDRSSTIELLKEKPIDLLVIGGGVHAAHAAHLATLNGLRVAVLCKGDFAEESDHFFLPQGKGFRHALKRLLKKPFIDSNGGYRTIIPNIHETLLAARQEGALCVNHAEVVLTHHEKTNTVIVTWVDRLSGAKLTLHAHATLNCAGQWVSMIGRISPAEFHRELIFERALQLIFNIPWQDPTVIPIAGGDIRIASHPSGTIVSSAMHRVAGPEVTHVPLASDVQSLIQTLNLAFPSAGFSSTTLHLASTVVHCRSLREQWFFSQGGLTLLDESAQSSVVLEGLRRIVALGGNRIAISPVGDRPLPGRAGDASNAIEHFRTEALRRLIPNSIIERVIARYCGRVRFFEHHPECYDLIGERILRGEIVMSIVEEGAYTVDDVMERRLQLHFTPDYGVPLLEAVVSEMKRLLPDQEYSAQQEAYLSRYSRAKT